MMTRRFTAHPLTCADFIRRFIPLLIIPLVRNIFLFLTRGDIYFSGWDITVTLSVVAVGLIRSRMFKLTVCGDRLKVQKGMLFKSAADIPIINISGVYTELDPLSARFGALRVRIETEAGGARKADLFLFLSKRDAAALLSILLKYRSDLFKRRSTVWQTALMALTSASALSGLLVWASVINYLGKLLDRRLDSLVLDTLSGSLSALSRLVPPAAAIAAALLSVGFCISFAQILIKHITFSVGSSDHILHISQGIIRRRQAYIRYRTISAVILKQPPVMRFFSRASLLITVAGYGKQGGESKVVIPALRIKNAADLSDKLGLLKWPQLDIKKARRARPRAAVVPAWLTAMSALPVITAVLFLPEATAAGALISGFCAALCLYRLDVSLAGEKQGGMHIGRTVRVKDARRLSLTDTCIELERVDCVTLTQTPFDRRWRVCSVTVRARGETGVCARVGNIDLKDADRHIKRAFGR